MNGQNQASPSPAARPSPVWVTYSGWPQALKEEIQDVARRRSVRERKRITASQVALEWILLGKERAAQEEAL